MKLFLTLIGITISSLIYCQTPIDVADNTLKVAGMGEEVFYYGFAAGDQIIFNFQEVNGKELKELEIMEMPSTSKFMDFKASKVENKTIVVNKTGVFKFRFSNSAVLGRICKFKIQRIPSSDATKNFNTSVSTRTVFDTTYTPVQEKYLVKSDTSIINVVDQIAKVSSQTAMNGNPNKTVVDFLLPDGTISWSYYIGVGNEGKEAYKDATGKFLSSSAKVVSAIPGYGAMAALALTGLSYFNKVQGNDNVKFYFITDPNSVVSFKSGGSFYQIKQGDVINDASRMTKPTKGKVYIGLLNDNIREAIEVTVKVTAISVKEEWGMRTVQKMNVTSHEEQYLRE